MLLFMIVLLFTSSMFLQATSNSVAQRNHMTVTLVSVILLFNSEIHTCTHFLPSTDWTLPTSIDSSAEPYCPSDSLSLFRAIQLYAKRTQEQLTSVRCSYSLLMTSTQTDTDPVPLRQVGHIPQRIDVFHRFTVQKQLHLSPTLPAASVNNNILV